MLAVGARWWELVGAANRCKMTRYLSRLALKKHSTFLDWEGEGRGDACGCQVQPHCPAPFLGWVESQTPVWVTIGNRTFSFPEHQQFPVSLPRAMRVRTRASVSCVCVDVCASCVCVCDLRQDVQKYRVRIQLVRRFRISQK